jgi:3-oxoacyl-(acyl-carrier-protein) synthase/acyl carrier protein
VVGCGLPVTGGDVRIVDPESGRERVGGEPGEIWVSGPHVTGGYWERADETERTFAASSPGSDVAWLRTGDLGYLRDGALFVTGRLKDLIIVRGANHHPQDIELTVERSDAALRPGCGAAFSVSRESGEEVVVVQEVKRTSLRSLETDAVLGRIRAAVAASHGVDLHAIALVRPGTVPKTSSGKVRRRDCKEAFLSGALTAVGGWTAAARAPSEGEAPARAARTPSQIVEWLVGAVAERSRRPPATIDVDLPFAAFGLNSRDAVRLSGELESLLGRRLSPTLIYDHPSIASLARHLSSGAEVGGEVKPLLATPASGGAIAVVGIGCRFPGADGPREFWRLLERGVNGVREISETRRKRRPHRPSPEPPGGFLADVARFDADFFGISPREAAAMDPQQRLLLEVAWDALTDAGRPPPTLAGSRTGVFVGISGQDYARLAAQGGVPLGAHSGTGGALCIAANRLSYVFDLHGPSVSLDTACSSSLVAVHHACQSLRWGECELALAGGVNVLLSPDITEMFASAGMMAKDGRCKSFDAGADGYVRGEGCGVVVLRRLEEAQRAGDRVWAVILGSAVNQDGRSNGLTAPSRSAQADVIRHALAAAAVTPDAVGYVEAHGTGTALGDPIEALALGDVFAPRDASGPLKIGSVKTNIGHLEAAAGIAGLVKAALCVRHGRYVPHLNFEVPSPKIPWAELPIRVAAPGDWDPIGSRRVAGVSSFGFGGTNAHVVLANAPEGVQESESSAPHAVVWSTKSEDALSVMGARHGASLAEAESGGLGGYCGECARADAGLEHRAVVVAADRAEAADALRALAEKPRRAHPDRSRFSSRARAPRPPGLGWPSSRPCPHSGGCWSGVTPRWPRRSGEAWPPCSSTPKARRRCARHASPSPRSSRSALRSRRRGAPGAFDRPSSWGTASERSVRPMWQGCSPSRTRRGLRWPAAARWRSSAPPARWPP